MTAIIVALLTGIIGGFFGLSTGYAGLITGGLSGIIVGYPYARYMLDQRKYQRDNLGKGAMLGMLAGFASGVLTHIPRVLLDIYGIKNAFLDVDRGFSETASPWMILVGALFGLFVGLIWGLILAAVFKRLPGSVSIPKSSRF